MADDGITRAACFVTSAYSSYSSCRQYREDLAGAAVGRARARRGWTGCGSTSTTPASWSRSSTRPSPRWPSCPESVREGAHLVFVTHSIPESMNEGSGRQGDAYVNQHRSVVAAVVERVRQETGRRNPHELVYCSRSGPPHVPWLEPDVNDHLEALSRKEAPGVVLVPIGFVSDHMEVVYDLDTEALATAAKLDLPAVRAATPGIDPRFVAVVRDLLVERAATERGEEPRRRAVGSLQAWWDLCGVGLLPEPPRRPAGRRRRRGMSAASDRGLEPCSRTWPSRSPQAAGAGP